MPPPWHDDVRSNRQRRISLSQVPTPKQSSPAAAASRIARRGRGRVLPPVRLRPVRSRRCNSTTWILPQRRSQSPPGGDAFARKARAEARKCVLLCANCHAKVEAGVAASRHSCRSPVAPWWPSGVAQWQSIRLLTGGLWVRVPPPQLQSPGACPPTRARLRPASSLEDCGRTDPQDRYRGRSRERSPAITTVRDDRLDRRHDRLELELVAFPRFNERGTRTDRDGSSGCCSSGSCPSASTSSAKSSDRTRRGVPSQPAGVSADAAERSVLGGTDGTRRGPDALAAARRPKSASRPRGLRVGAS